MSRRAVPVPPPVVGREQVTQALVTLADKAMYAERRRLPGSGTDLA